MQRIVKQLLVVTLFLFFYTKTAEAQTIVPTQTDEIIIDNGASGKADPNDRIRYKVTIQNTGGPAGTNTQLNIVPDPRTTLVPGSFRSSPLAINDAYACTGNVGINVPAASGVKVNDFDDNPGGLTVTAGTFPSSQGGSVMIAADGSFMYTPPAGFTGSDTYMYTLNDGNGVGAPVPATDVGTVTITVSNLIWFIDNSSVAATSDGRLTSPFKTLTDFNASALPAANQVIFVKNTGTNYTGGIVLKNGQSLFSTGHTGGSNLADAGVLPFSLAANSKPLPAINGTRPMITNAAGDGVTLAMNNSLRGFDVGACSDFGMENSGTTSVGNLVVSEVSINNTTGGGFDASHGSGASMNAVFSSISATGGTNGINLTNCAGTFTVNGGTITNPTGTGALVSGGSVVVSCAAVITDNTGFAVDIDNHDSGNATFSGDITSTATGIRVQNCGGGTKTFSGSSKSLNTGANTAVTLSSNTGATITISGGGLVVSTTTAIGINATGGGTVNVTGSGNTINSTSGATALNVVGTTIGASNLNFQSISSNGGSAPGIILQNTGSAGGLTVDGDGSNTTRGGNSTGGTIANKDDGGTNGSGNIGTAIFLDNTSNITLRRMTINGTNQNYGVYGSAVTNVKMEYCSVTGVNGDNTPAREGSVVFDNVFGNANSIFESVISGAIEDNLRVENSSGTLASFIISNNNIQNNSTVSGNIGIRFASKVSGSMTGTISNNSLSGNRTDAINCDAGDNSSLNITISGNVIVRGAPNEGNLGINVTSANQGQVTFDVDNNKVGTPDGVINQSLMNTGINVFAGGSTTAMTGYVRNNIVINRGAGFSGFGIRVISNGSAAPGATTITTEVSNNIVRNVGLDYGLIAEASGTSAASLLEIKVTGNNVSVLSSALDAIRVQSRQTSTICARISGNTTSLGGVGGATCGPDFCGLMLRQANTAVFNLEGGTSSLAVNNPAAASSSFLGTITTVAANFCGVIP
ncbi:MAG: cadherin-like domain-containing protein [Saprospiraceae bacterium]|nr:cadherin-like domain-containing protein [Saprospiraceae bacterium]